MFLEDRQTFFERLEYCSAQAIRYENKINKPYILDYKSRNFGQFLNR